MAQEPPLSERELRMVRGMIDEYTHQRERRLVAVEFWTTGRRVVVSTAAVTMWILVVVGAVLTIFHA